MLKCVVKGKLRLVQNVKSTTVGWVVQTQHQRRNYASGRTKDYYEILEVKRNSTRKEIKLAYYKLSKLYHPDVCTTGNSDNKYKEIQEAYHTLGDENRKIDYDMAMRDGYYGGGDGGSGDSTPGGGGNFNPNQNFRRRNSAGPVYSGRTASYDYDEHFRSHYGSSARGQTNMHASSFGSKSTRSMNDEELKNYWNRKDFQSGEMTMRNSFIYRSLYLTVFFIVFYICLKTLHNREKELARRGYQNAVSAKSSPK
jgi:curved DNA-binding protein CbpA